MTGNSAGKVFLIQTSDRKGGVNALLDQFDLGGYSDSEVALKANFNSADPFPASTHLDTLEALVKRLKRANVTHLTLAERSGMGNTRKALEKAGVFDLSEKLGFKVVVLDEVGKDGWVKIKREGTHWLRGFYVSRLFLEASKVIQTCCLKTHRFGGHFTLSLKNSVDLVAKRLPGGSYDYMAELHGSPYQRLMTAEINRFYNVDIVVMDAMKAFISRGPESGDLVEPGFLLASKDRIAVDAAGVAILRSCGPTGNVTKGRIFDLDQIRRASELGIGVKSASEIEVVPINDEARPTASKIENILRNEG